MNVPGGQLLLSALPAAQSRRWLPLLAAALALLAWWLAALGAAPLVDVDEGAFAEASREMLASGDWGHTTLNAADRFDKPILVYWLQAAALALFGTTESAVRLPSALCAATWCAAAGAYAAHRWGAQAAGAWLQPSKRAVWLSVAVVLAMAHLAWSTVPWCITLAQAPVRALAREAVRRELPLVQWNLHQPSVGFYADQPAPRRPPQAGEAMLVRLDRLPALAAIQPLHVLAQARGYALVALGTAR